MSHLPQRKEKNCLNCGTHVLGRYCHTCGQQNIEPKETVWNLVTHFFNDITHFDGKFFTSLKVIILKPGFLSKEYIIGKRASYLNPIRMYLFTSAVFFLVFFAVYKVDKSISISNSVWGMGYEDFEKMDSLALSDFTRAKNNGKPLSLQQVKDTLNNTAFNIAPGNYHSKKEYDSVLKTGVKKHNWIERQMVYKNIEIKDRYGSDSKVIVAALLNKFMHSLPQMLFLLLPLFALILKLVYIRRKQFYVVDHTILTIHLYVFIFLVMLLTFGIGKVKILLNWNWLSYISSFLVLIIFFYFYKALRNFYKQGRAKTILKYFILIILFTIITILMFIFFLFFSIFGL